MGFHSVVKVDMNLRVIWKSVDVAVRRIYDL